MIRLTLPFPISTNRIWRAYKGRNILTEDYRRWKALAASEIALQRPERLIGAFRITATLYRRDRRKLDLDNRAKALLDALVAAKVIEDDSLAHQITLRWGEGIVPGGRAEVELEEVR